MSVGVQSIDIIIGEIFTNYLIVGSVLIGLVLILIGVGITTYSEIRGFGQLVKKSPSQKMSKGIDILDRATSLFIFNSIKKDIKNKLLLNNNDETRIKLISSISVLGLFFTSVLTLYILKDIGQLWYVKVMIIAICLFLPYYILGLIFDLYRQSLNRNIPSLVDEFRGAFIKHGKIRPAFKECSQNIDKNIGSLVLKAAESPYMEKYLLNINKNLENVWFNIFISMILNFKENGGQLIDQLYKLNKTITKFNMIEKKKNKRLLWYEIFAVFIAVFSIPAIFWANGMILGIGGGAIIDADSNIIVSKIILYCLLALVVVRVLRRI